MPDPTSNVTSTDGVAISIAMSADYQTMTVGGGTPANVSTKDARIFSGLLDDYAKVMENS